MLAEDIENVGSWDVAGWCKAPTKLTGEHVDIGEDLVMKERELEDKKKKKEEEEKKKKIEEKKTKKTSVGGHQAYD